jgi:Rha family phage regulatory protein
MHKNVLQSWRNLESQCSAEFYRLNFQECKIKDLAGVEFLSHVLMTRDGFMLLTMGWTGNKVMPMKEAWIARFNAMEEELRSRPTATFNVRDSLVWPSRLSSRILGLALPVNPGALAD